MLLENLQSYNNNLDESHKNIRNTGYEIHDRNIFINHILKPLGYGQKNILHDVPQRGDKGSKSPDIRLYGKKEYKSKHSYSQFIIETKNYKLLSEKNYIIDYLQLKRYIKFNESKIRLIGLTDYQTLILFNATEIKKNTKINFNNLDKITDFEIEVFEQNIIMSIDLEDESENTINKLKIISHAKIFENQKFINPQEYERTNSINNPYVRKNFIFELYHLMIRLQNQIVPNFESKILDVQSQVTMREVSWNEFMKLIMSPHNEAIMNFFWWGIEMNYLDNFMEDKKKYDVTLINKFLNDREKKDSFVLTSIYNIINKTMFLRILEDSNTKSTKFLEGLVNGRYISNGILEMKRKEGKDSLLRHFVNVFKFDQPDLKPYSFILSRDIYNWVLNENEYSITDLLIELVRLFNDINFSKVNQDILGDIYEHYLDQEEEKGSERTARRLLGQYYTPKPIVRLMWYLTRDVIQKYQSRDLYSKGNDYLNIIDPACGSGTFISETILHINESASKSKINKNGKVFHFIKDRDESKRIENNLFGFEINPLSKSIADINLFFALIQAYGENSSEEVIDDINVYRTNSLNLSDSKNLVDENDIEEKVLFLKTEIKKSYMQNYKLNLAKSQKYDVVIGNPPYGSMDVNKIMKKELIPFAFAENNFDFEGVNIKFKWDNKDFSGKVPSNEKNSGKLNDLYGYFFGLADILCEDEGIISFITSNTYLTIPTYKWFRKYILENYTIEYIINFNKISEKGNSIFFPDAGVATSIIIMRKKIADSNHEINYLDLSKLDNIKEKYEAFCDITWNKKTGILNKNDIKNFLVKPISKMGFQKIHQSSLYKNSNYIFSFNEFSETELLNKLENNSVRITSYGSKNTGIDVGDLELVKKNKKDLKSVIEETVFKKDFSNMKRTLREHLKKQFKKNKINTIFDDNKVEKFVYQKHLQPYSFKEISLTYFDENILWRHRIYDKCKINNNPIHSTFKLFILERRAKGQLISLVTSEKILPQHGGRFMYLVPSENCSVDDLYMMAGIINSKVIQYLYRNRLIGNKDILIPDIGRVQYDIKMEIIDTSKKIHSLENHKYNYYNKLEEMYSLYNEQIKINLFTDNNYWEVHQEDNIIQDYNVNEIIFDEELKFIKMNNNLYITADTSENLRMLYEQVKNYEGNLINKPLIINLLKFTNTEKEYLLTLDNQIKTFIDHIDKLVYQIYHLNDEEIKKINM
ncbi:Eco57I restriction-modification methylase domain-containing protein [Staphylococcus arlettae]|uniref:HsdM family class I SAM-dependent methyltransferase n=1 Tax=Staphylococcus arlettae TaxID=29378 RepID=UPI001E5D4885|nr:Eco57I restriction-modification methylase domain-containing protein [Staphylococcus arlettae]